MDDSAQQGSRWARSVRYTKGTVHQQGAGTEAKATEKR